VEIADDHGANGGTLTPTNSLYHSFQTVSAMNIFYIIGVILVILVILGFLGLR